MIDNRDVEYAAEDGKREAFERDSRRPVRAMPSIGNGGTSRPIFRVGPAGSQLSFHGSALKEEEQKMATQSSMDASLISLADSPGATKSAPRRDHGRVSSQSQASMRDSRVPTSAPGGNQMDAGFQQFLDANGFSDRGPALPPPLRPATGPGGSF